MPSVSSVYDQRLSRIKAAVALEPVDRVPVVLQYAGFAAEATGVPMADYLSSFERATETMIAAYNLVAEVGAADAVNYGTFNPYGLASLFGSKVRVPGVELADDELWQVLEDELMTRDDYDAILDIGWPEWWNGYFNGRVLDDAAERLKPWNMERIDIPGRWRAAGVPLLSGGDVTTPVELLSGSRTLPKFSFDLYQVPDQVERVMDEMVQHLSAGPIKSGLASGCPVMWIVGTRSAPFWISPQMWDRFVWPHYRRLALEVIDAGMIALLHCDSDWTRELERFKELPPGKCILSLDGETDIRKAKEVLDGHMCIMGDVSAASLAFGTPDEVYEYSTGLIRDLGPEGFILHSGCDIPSNARLENVQAMVNAALDS